jgi:hypothetical protein
MLAALAAIELTARSTGSTAGSCARTVGPPVKVLATLRCVASLTGLVVVAEIGEVTRFDSASKLALVRAPARFAWGTNNLHRSVSDRPISSARSWT